MLFDNPHFLACATENEEGAGSRPVLVRMEVALCARSVDSDVGHNGKELAGLGRNELVIS